MCSAEWDSNDSSCHLDRSANFSDYPCYINGFWKYVKKKFSDGIELERNELNEYESAIFIKHIKFYFYFLLKYSLSDFFRRHTSTLLNIAPTKLKA